MKNKKRFSVLISVYNCEKYIKPCLDSVLAQTYDLYSIVVIDDGSTDGSGQICDDYAALHGCISVIHQPNAGIMAVRNKALKYVEGDFFIFLDGDDFWDPHLLERVNHEISMSEADIVFFRLKHVDEIGIFTYEEESIFTNETIIDSNQKRLIFEKMIVSSKLNNLVCKAIRSSLIDFYEFSDMMGVEHAEDLMFSLSFVFHAKKMIYLDEALYNYRNVPNSITHKISPRFFLDVAIVRTELLKYIQLLGLDTTDNLVSFYQFYLRGVVSYLSRLCVAMDNKKSLYSIFDELHSLPLFTEAYQLVGTKGIPFYNKATLWLLIRRKYDYLIGYEHSKHCFRRLKKVLHKKQKRVVV